MIHVIVTVDTEGDNLWQDQQGRSFTNIAALGGFQQFCQELGLHPTYLVAHEVIADPAARAAIGALQAGGGCELGAHLHAWLTPPFYSALDDSGKSPFLHEYPEEIRAAKLERLTSDLAEVLGQSPTSYRGGRWSIEAFTMGQLQRLGYVADTTVTPFISWVRTLGLAAGGPNCTQAPHVPYHPHVTDPMCPGDMDILEVPTAHRPANALADGWYRGGGRLWGASRAGWSLFGRGLGVIMGKVVSPNPAVTPLAGLAQVVRRVAQEKPAVLNLSIHSSELFAGGAPWVRDTSMAEAVWQRFRDIVQLVSSLAEWRGVTLSEYARQDRLSRSV